MPIGKSTNKNKEKGDRGEALTQKMFGLAPTSGSGCGRFDKQDSKNEWLRVETKTTEKDHYVLNLKKWELWRQQAAKARSQFFLHLIPEETWGLDWDASLVVITDSYAKALGAYDTSGIANTQEWINGKSVKINFLSGRYLNLAISERESFDFTPITFYDGEGLNLVSLPAPYFKELLEKAE